MLQTGNVSNRKKGIASEKLAIPEQSEVFYRASKPKPLNIYDVYNVNMAETISVRVSAEIKEELRKYAKDEKLEQTSEAARKLLMIGLEDWHKENAIELFSKGVITLSKAAEIAKVSVWEFSDIIKQRGIIWIKKDEFLKDDLKFRF